MTLRERGRAAQVAKAFLTPGLRLRPNDLSSLFGGGPVWIAGPVGKVALYQEGRGPAVLFVHGWEGQVNDFAPLIRGCVHAGFRVIAVDLPGHGASDGATVSIPTCAESLMSAERALGEFYAVIGHSVGSLAAVHAAALGFHAKRMVLISSPARYEDYARKFGIRSGLSLEQTDEMIEMLEAMGTSIRSISLPAIAESLEQDALFIHSRDDRVVPFSEGLEGANAWRRTSFLQVDGLGHKRILQSSIVMEAALKFLTDGIHVAL